MTQHDKLGTLSPGFPICRQKVSARIAVSYICLKKDYGLFAQQDLTLDCRALAEFEQVRAVVDPWKCHGGGTIEAACEPEVITHPEYTSPIAVTRYRFKARPRSTSTGASTIEVSGVLTMYETVVRAPTIDVGIIEDESCLDTPLFSPICEVYKSIAKELKVVTYAEIPGYFAFETTKDAKDGLF